MFLIISNNFASWNWKLTLFPQPATMFLELGEKGIDIAKKYTISSTMFPSFNANFQLIV